MYQLIESRKGEWRPVALPYDTLDAAVKAGKQVLGNGLVEAVRVHETGARRTVANIERGDTGIKVFFFD